MTMKSLYDIIGYENPKFFRHAEVHVHKLGQTKMKQYDI